jgi:para-aminobenzoate synthetase / 4-amino-4-deoxychorismate lyase
MKTITNNRLMGLLDFLSGNEQFVFLDTAKPDQDNTTSMLFLDPIERLRYHQGDDIEKFFEKVKSHQRDGNYLAGWISYEFGYVMEGILHELLCRPGDIGALLADFGVFRRRYTFDHRSGETDFPKLNESNFSHSFSNITNVTLSQDRDDYLRAIGRILDYISAGDTYQVNYTLKLLFQFSGSAEHLYQKLRRNQSVSYGAYIRWGNERILSFSPELFFRKGNDSVIVRPMKGTMKRGKTLTEDGKNCKYLEDDIKNRSENVMIVDLLRNDLGRLMHYAENGDVSVNSLFDVEVYETLLQMTSTITAKTTVDSLTRISLSDFFRALFPCGSVTGAPKIRTMQIINELEKDRRGVYTGAIGYLAPTGEAMFNVPIRTVVLHGDFGEMGIGSGIVHDSNPEQEWQECLLKGRFLTEPEPEFQLIETFLYHQKDGYWLLEEHLQRLKMSASYFLFICDLSLIRAQLLDQSRNFKGGCMRVRLSLAKDGTLLISSLACDEPTRFRLPENPLSEMRELPSISFSATRTDPQLPWFYHKTTRRDLYDREYIVAKEKGLYDICFCNTDGEVTEGCITNIILYKKGLYFTPPVRCGLLAGVMRERLLQDKDRPLVEKPFTYEEIREADALFLCNSVRGVVQVQLVEG